MVEDDDERGSGARASGSGLDVYLASAGLDLASSCIPAWRSMAAIDRVGVHRLVGDPEQADIVLFTECHLIDDWRLRAVYRSPVARAHWDRAFVYDERDRPWCGLPGLYVSMPESDLRTEWQAAAPYYQISEIDGVEPPERDLLFSFVASASHPCRLPLFELSDSRGVVSRADGFVFYDSSSRNFEERRRLFADTILRSQFVLCPRGVGTSSIRAYEVCAAGRVPVVISDDWAEPAGPDWSTFSVRWPEGETEGLVEHLASRASESDAMGRLARAAYEEWFAPEVSFHRLVDRLAPLVRDDRDEFPRGGIRTANYWPNAYRAGRARVRRTARSAVDRARR